MKTKIFLTAIFTFVFAMAISAQVKTTDYSGVWNLDASKSKLNERRKIESMTMTVSQIEKELKIESAVKLAEDANAPEPRNAMGGMRRGGMGGGGNESTVYVLDGKEVVNDMTAAAAGKYTYKGTQEKDGKLKLEQTREFQSPMGQVKIKSTESWSLSTDGKTLTVKRDTETPRGTNSSEMIFTKK